MRPLRLGDFSYMFMLFLITITGGKQTVCYFHFKKERVKFQYISVAPVICIL